MICFYLLFLHIFIHFFFFIRCCVDSCQFLSSFYPFDNKFVSLSFFLSFSLSLPPLSSSFLNDPLFSSLIPHCLPYIPLYISEIILLFFHGLPSLFTSVIILLLVCGIFCYFYFKFIYLQSKKTSRSPSLTLSLSHSLSLFLTLSLTLSTLTSSPFTFSLTLTHSPTFFLSLLLKPISPSYPPFPS